MVEITHFEYALHAQDAAQRVFQAAAARVRAGVMSRRSADAACAHYAAEVRDVLVAFALESGAAANDETEPPEAA